MSNEDQRTDEQDANLVELFDGAHDAQDQGTSHVAAEPGSSLGGVQSANEPLGAPNDYEGELATLQGQTDAERKEAERTEAEARWQAQRRADAATLALIADVLRHSLSQLDGKDVLHVWQDDNVLYIERDGMDALVLHGNSNEIYKYQREKFATLRAAELGHSIMPEWIHTYNNDMYKINRCNTCLATGVIPYEGAAYGSLFENRCRPTTKRGKK